MISNLLAIVLPTFGIIGVGLFARRIGIWDKDSVNVLNKYAYYIALPALILSNVLSLPHSELLNAKNFYMIFGTLAAHIIVAVGVFLLTILFKAKREIRAIAPMLTTFGSTAYLGIPFVTYLVGKEGTAYAALISVLLVVVLLFLNNALLNKLDSLPNTQNKLSSLLEFPFLWAVVIGVTYNLFQLPSLPLPLSRFLDVLAGSAGPTALLGIGTFLYDIHSKEIPWLRSSFFAAVKVFCVPLVTLLFMWFLKVDGLRLTVALSLSAVSTGVTAFVLAQEHKLGTKETAGTILISNFFSLTALIFISYFSLR